VTEPPLAPRVCAAAVAELSRVGILRNPYFVALQSGAMTFDRFLGSQQQFSFAVTHFPRPMAALLARLPHPRQRLDILRNLVEEHGHFREAAFHHSTFRDFLATLGCPSDSLDAVRAGPAVRAFNAVLSAAAALDEVEVGVACLGVVEYAFAGLSARIGEAVVGRGWVPADQLVHYRRHAEIDERHGEEFFAVVEPLWQDDRHRHGIEDGLALGAYAFDRLYRDLLTDHRDEETGIGSPT